MSTTSRTNITTTTLYDAAAGTVRACRRGTRTLLWAGRVLLAVCFVSASVLKVASTGYMVHARAEVRFCLPDVGVGVEFVEISDEARHAIEAELASWNR